MFGPRAEWRKTIWGEFLSEYLGTFVLIAFGCGCVAMAVAALNGSGRAQTPTTIFLAAGDWLLIAWGWGFAVVFGVYVAGGISGAHINPAVTLAFAVRRKFPWRKVPHYILAQFMGALTGAALVYAVYRDAITAYDTAANAVRGQVSSVASFSIFATFPAGYFDSWTGPFVDQVVGTAFLVIFVFAVIDKLNVPVMANLGPFMIGMAVVAIGMSFGANAGYAINPARDFGPRLFAWIEGWGKIALPGNYGNVNDFFWIPIVGPFAGAVVGAIVYDVFIHHVLTSREEPETPPGRTGADPDEEK